MLGAIGSFVSGGARLFLFFASLLFLVGSSTLLYGSSRGRTDLSSVQISGIRTVLSIAVGFSIYLILLAIVGIFASFFSSKGYIKLLAVMTALNVGIGVAVLVIASPKIDLVQKELVSRLKGYQDLYDWDHTSTNPDQVKATTAWDSIQKDIQCCGVDDSRDWLVHRPKGHESESILPKSCCQFENDTKGTGYCLMDKYSIWPDGCSENLENVFTFITDLLLLIIIFNGVVFSLTFIVLCCAPNSSRSYNDGVRY